MWPNKNNFASFGIDKKKIFTKKLYLYKVFTKKTSFKKTKKVNDKYMTNKNPVPAAMTARIIKEFLYVFLSFQSIVNALTSIPKRIPA